MFTGFNEFRVMFEENNFDVMMLSETWLSHGVDADGFNIPGYRFFHRDRVGRGGGVAAYVRNTLLVDILEFDFEVSDLLECLFLKIKIATQMFIFGVFYRPPNTNLTHLINDFDKILSYTSVIADEVVCVGDMNVDFFNVENPLNTCFESYNFSQLLQEATRVTNSTSKLLDPIFVTNTDIIVSKGTMPVGNISDHLMTFCELRIEKPRVKPKFVKYRCFRNFNLEIFLTDLQTLQWDNIYYENNIENKIAMMNKFIIDTFDEHAPIKEAKVTKQKAPWLTQNVKNFMKQRDIVLQRFKKYRTSDNWVNYKRLRNFTVSAVRRAKKEYLDMISSENNSRKTWDTLGNLNVRSDKSITIPEHLSGANELNNFFAEFLQNDSDFKCQDKIDFYLTNRVIDNSFSFQLATVSQVHKILHDIGTNAVGLDGISAAMLKYCSPYIDIYILHIINCSIESNYFPDLWKTSIGKPLPKKPNPNSYSDLRVISILPAVSKIFEKVLYLQIYNFVTINKILPDTQCGFRKGYSTSVALTNVIDDVIRARDNGQDCVLVLLDYSRAFDTINHRLMCSKLKYFGFDDQSFNLINSYLGSRKQKIFSNNSFSDEANIISGVPQGSILGPLLFLIYTSDILRALNYCNVQAYADDTQIYYPFDYTNFLQAAEHMNSDLKIISQLSEEHNLKINPSKSCAVLFGNKSHIDFLKANFIININNEPIEFVTEAKNLGIIMDSELRFAVYVKKVLQKAFFSMKLLYSNRHILNFRLKKMLCESLVLSNFNYGDFVWGPCLDAVSKNRIQVIQNNCSRFVCGLRKYDHVSHTFRDLNWLRMENRRLHHLGCFIFKILSDTDAVISLRNKFVKRGNVHAVNIRSTEKMTMPLHRTALFQRSFTYNAVKLLNSLPSQLLNINVKKFKLEYKRYLISQQNLQYL